MPRVSAPTPAIANAEYDETMKLLQEFHNVWTTLQVASPIDPIKFSRLSVVALTQLSAMVAVDVGMPLPNFLAVCGAQHKAAYAKAPKFS